MNFFLASNLVEDVEESLGCNKAQAMKELLRQSRRIFAAYTASPVHHSKYWNKVDAAALFALSFNRQIPKKQLDVALTDLEKAEAIVAELRPPSQDVYNDFSYFIEKINKACSTRAEMEQRIEGFTGGYNAGQLQVLVSYLKDCLVSKSSDKRIRSLNEVAKRVRSALSSKLRGKFVNRVELAVEFLERLAETRKEADPADLAAAETQKIEPESETLASVPAL